MSDPSCHQEMTPKAAEAFRQFVALGPSRSLRALAESLVQQEFYKTSSVAFRMLSEWSSRYRWQERIAQAATAASERMLAEAAELDAETFLKSSTKLNDLIKDLTDSGEIVRIRESVRKPMPKGGASVNVNVSVEVQRLVDRVAAEDGMTEDERAELLASVQRHLDGVRS